MKFAKSLRQGGSLTLLAGRGVTPYFAINEILQRDTTSSRPDLQSTLTCRTLSQEPVQNLSSFGPVNLLKALLEAQKGFEGSDESSRLKACANAVEPNDYQDFGVSGFGLSGFQYLRMLLGVQTIKPDVHICRFVSEAIGRNVGDEEGLVLMEPAGKQLEWPLSRLDYVIWDQGSRGDARLEMNSRDLLIRPE